MFRTLERESEKGRTRSESHWKLEGRMNGKTAQRDASQAEQRGEHSENTAHGQQDVRW